MKNRFSTFVLLIILFCPAISFSQSNWIVYNKSNSGICSDTVTSIYNDSDTLWLGTMRGVSKFDGSNWTSYTSSNAPFNEANNIRAIISYKGALYFGSSGSSGLVKYDGTNWSSIPGFYGYR